MYLDAEVGPESAVGSYASAATPNSSVTVFVLTAP